VVGTSRDAAITSFQNLVKLGIRDRVRIMSATLTDFRSLIRVLLEVEPDERVVDVSGG
jgi:GDPmannose 4,6-dehydratase